jgi:hypothetical protein
MEFQWQLHPYNASMPAVSREIALGSLLFM